MNSQGAAYFDSFQEIQFSFNHPDWVWRGTQL